MKNVILSAAALFCGAVMFGQVGGAPEADSQTNVINQSANADANKGESEQYGDHQRVRVRQAGTQQSVFTLQANGDGIGGNQANILQSGSVGPLSGRKNDAEVYQFGSLNSSRTIQEGNRNNAITEQGMEDAASSGNSAFVRQGDGGNAEDNFAAVEQDGIDNQAITIQVGDNNDAWTNQEGNDLRSRIEQNGSPEDTEGHWALVNQYDNNNESWIKQEGDGARNYAEVLQAGDDNYADQYQDTDATTGDANSAFIRQGRFGLANTELGFDSGIANLESKVFNLDDNVLPTSSYSQGAKAFQDQVGDENQAIILQHGELAGNPPVGNYADQDQLGDNNDAHIIQNAWGNPAGGGNKAKQFQDGDNNEAGISQDGTGHKAFQSQLGDSNEAISSQRGLMNKAFTYQNGDDNYVTTAQRGQMNKIVVSQYGGQSYVAQQNVPGALTAGVGMPFGNNQIDVIQMGPGGTVDGVAAACLLPMDEMQTWRNLPSLDLPDICVDCD